MAEKKVNVSISPMKLIIFLVIAAVLVALFLMRSKDKEADLDQILDGEKEVILPQETGVADSGFEKKNASFVVLNAQADYENLEEIDGAQSLKISFSDRPTSSVKIGDYLNDIEPDKFYRLSFWSRNVAEKEKKVTVNLSGDRKSQGLGEFTLPGDGNTHYYEFNFQAEDAMKDLVLTATDGVGADILLDDFRSESLDIDSKDQLEKIIPTVFGDTSWKNVDEIQTKSDKNSEELLSEAPIKIGQVFQPSETLLSGVAFKIQKVGTGGDGTYRLQLREYDQGLGIISDDMSALANIYTEYPPSVTEEMKERAKQMRNDLIQKEKDIKAGIIPNDRTTEEYPEKYTQKQIDLEKAKKRKTNLELAISAMKESYNVPQELEIPISARLDTDKKYWIGIDNSGAKVDEDNYIKVFYNSKPGPGSETGFISDAANTWKEYNTLWLKAFYSSHSQKEGEKIMSGSTLSDFGNGRMLYRYQFSGRDGSFASGYPGRKILDMYDGNFTSSDVNGNYLLSGPGQYAIYKFNTFYPAKKITLRDIVYHQSIGIDFSSDGQNWKEILSENPSDNSQKADPLTISLEEDAPSFYLRIKPDGNDCTPLSLSLEAELDGCGTSGCGAAAEPDVSLEQPNIQEENVSQTARIAIYNGSETKGLAAAIADNISGISDIQVTQKSNAKGNYDKNIVVDLTGNNGSKVEEIAAAINGELGSLPDGETNPDADILVIGAAL